MIASIGIIEQCLLQKRDSHIKTIPAFKPIGVELGSPETTPEKIHTLTKGERGRMGLSIAHVSYTPQLNHSHYVVSLCTLL